MILFLSAVSNCRDIEYAEIFTLFSSQQISLQKSYYDWMT